jgi:hypothetical protein
VNTEGGRVEGSLRLKKILVEPAGFLLNICVTLCFQMVHPCEVPLFFLGSIKVLTPQRARTDSGNLINHFIWASGSSNVFMVKMVAESTIAKFRDHIDADNKHIVRLGKRDLVVDGNSYSVICMQTKGGGHFPIKGVHQCVPIKCCATAWARAGWDRVGNCLRTKLCLWHNFSECVEVHCIL